METLYKDICVVKCEESLAKLQQDANIWTDVLKCDNLDKVTPCDDLREKLRTERMVKVFKGLKSELVTGKLACFRVIKFKANGPEEEPQPAHTAPHPLLLSLRSMNSITNHFYGDLPNGKPSGVLVTSCYRGMEEGMVFDCEHCLRNRWGHHYAEEGETYVMGPYGLELR